MTASEDSIEDLDWLLSRGRRLGAARVLDIAPGAGDLARGLAAFTPSVVIANPVGAAIRQARVSGEPAGTGIIRVAGADPAALPFKDASFRVVTCRGAAHRFPELLPVLRQIARVLRPGGSLLVADVLGHDDPELAAFVREVERRRDPGHVRAFRQIEWTAFLRAAGLTVIDEAVTSRVLAWDDWAARTSMGPEAKRELERFVVGAPPPCRDALAVELCGDRIASLTERALLLRADKD